MATRRTPKPGERVALGQRIENEVQAIVGGDVGRGLDPKRPMKLTVGASMDGKRIHLQRVIKQTRAMKRVGAWLGTGAGKTIGSIGAFTDLHATGDTTHGLFLVPKAVQTQFGDEMLNFTEPGKYRFDTGAGKGPAERVSMLADKGTHMRVLTHSSATRIAALRSRPSADRGPVIGNREHLGRVSISTLRQIRQRGDWLGTTWVLA